MRKKELKSIRRYCPQCRRNMQFNIIEKGERSKDYTEVIAKCRVCNTTGHFFVHNFFPILEKGVADHETT